MAKWVKLLGGLPSPITARGPGIERCKLPMCGPEQSEWEEEREMR